MSVQDVLSHVCDVDSHEQIPLSLWVEKFGSGATAIQSLLEKLKLGVVNFSRPEINSDVMEISESIVWREKGADAPSAIDLTRRGAVLDAMGVQKQLVFPTMALGAEILVNDPNACSHFQFDPGEVNAKEIGREALASYNDWALRVGKTIDSDRIRLVGMLLSESVDTMIAEAEHLIGRGIRGLSLASGMPPGGSSPADPAMDPLWSMLEESNAPVLLHLGGEHGFISADWHKNVSEFAFGEQSSLEFPVEPFRASIMNLSPETYLSAMVMGGVFEAHPRLRFGIIECGAQWLGPLAERLDMWSEQFTKRLRKLTEKPSVYINRNVRVTPFYFEPISTYFERWPDLCDVYCFSTDYPRREGGRDTKKRFFDELTGQDEGIIEKFFVTNGTYLLP